MLSIAAGLRKARNLDKNKKNAATDGTPRGGMRSIDRSGRRTRQPVPIAPIVPINILLYYSSISLL